MYVYIVGSVVTHMPSLFTGGTITPVHVCRYISIVIIIVIPKLK